MIAGDLSNLTRQKIGRVGEYMARTEFTRRGYTVYVPDVDDQGVDLLVHRVNRYLRVQVKTLRAGSYVFMRKSYLQPVEDLALCLIVIRDGRANMYLVPATRWLDPDAVFVSRDYAGLKSQPEFGLSPDKARTGSARGVQLRLNLDGPTLPHLMPQSSCSSLRATQSRGNPDTLVMDCFVAPAMTKWTQPLRRSPTKKPGGSLHRALSSLACCLALSGGRP